MQRRPQFFSSQLRAPKDTYLGLLPIELYSDIHRRRFKCLFNIRINDNNDTGIISLNLTYPDNTDFSIKFDKRYMRKIGANVSLFINQTLHRVSTGQRVYNILQINPDQRILIFVIGNSLILNTRASTVDFDIFIPICDEIIDALHQVNDILTSS